MPSCLVVKSASQRVAPYHLIEKVHTHDRALFRAQGTSTERLEASINVNSHQLMQRPSRDACSCSRLWVRSVGSSTVCIEARLIEYWHSMCSRLGTDQRLSEPQSLSRCQNMLTIEYDLVSQHGSSPRVCHRSVDICAFRSIRC